MLAVINGYAVVSKIFFVECVKRKITPPAGSAKFTSSAKYNLPFCTVEQ